MIVTFRTTDAQGRLVSITADNVAKTEVVTEVATGTVLSTRSIAAELAADAAFHAAGLLREQADAALATNEKTLRDKATTALTANATYLALASPSTAQNTAQIKSLTRQVNAVIRLVNNALDSTAGT